MTNVLPAPEGETGFDIPVSHHPVVAAVKQTVCLNSIIQAVLLEERMRIEKQNVIIRCDNLPAVLMNKEAVQKVCRTLLSIILDQPPKRGKLFLYVKCNVLGNDMMDMSLPDGLKLYEICFHANSSPLSAWTDVYNEALEFCRTTCMQYGGNFFYNNNSDGQYLFRVTLPGKSNEHATG